MVSKKKALAIALACAVVSVLATSVASARTDAQPLKLRKVTLAYAPITDYAPIFLGLRLGIFKKNGIDLKTTNTNITPSSLVAASLSGQVDIATNSATATMTAVSQGIPCKLLAAASTTPTKGNTEILVRANSDIRRFRDLAGKTVGTVGLQGFFHLLTLNAVDKDGGDYTKVRAVPGAQFDSLNTLLAGRVDAVVLQDPFNTLAKANNAVRSIGNPLGLFDQKTTAGVMIACGEIFQKKPDTLRRFVRGWKQAVDICGLPSEADQGDHPEVLRSDPGGDESDHHAELHDRPRASGDREVRHAHEEVRLDQGHAALVRRLRLEREVVAGRRTVRAGPRPR